MEAVDSRGCTTPPALNIRKLLIIRALSYAVNRVCRPPACFVEARFRFNQASDLLFSPSAIMAPPCFFACLWCKDKGWMGRFALRFEIKFQTLFAKWFISLIDSDIWW